MWVKKSVKGGIIPKANVKINLKAEDFLSKNFPNDFVQAIINVKSTNVDYSDSLPDIKNINSILHFDGNSMLLEEGAGSIEGGGEISNASLHIKDLTHNNMPLIIKGEVKAKAADVVNFLGRKQFKFDDKFMLNPQKILGDILLSKSKGLGFKLEYINIKRILFLVDSILQI